MDILFPLKTILYHRIYSLLLKEMALGNLHGIQISRGAPSISHLFYVDDTRIFVRANREEA